MQDAYPGVLDGHEGHTPKSCCPLRFELFISRKSEKSQGRFTLTRTVRVVRSVKCNSREQLANQADFRRIFYLLIPAGRKLYLKSMQYAALNNVLCSIFAISLCIPSRIDARQPAIFGLSLGDTFISVFVQAYVCKSPGPDGIHPRSINAVPLKIFETSLLLKELPYDWRTANISAIHKRAINQNSAIICKLMEKEVIEITYQIIFGQ